MFSVKKPYQVLRSVIVLNPIKVMDNPPFRQGFAVSLFPNKNMLGYISTLNSSGMFGLKHINIASVHPLSALPTRVFIAPSLKGIIRCCFSGTTMTTVSRSLNKLTTILAGMFTLLPVTVSCLFLCFALHINNIISLFCFCVNHNSGTQFLDVKPLRARLDLDEGG